MKGTVSPSVRAYCDTEKRGIIPPGYCEGPAKSFKDILEERPRNRADGTRELPDFSSISDGRNKKKTIVARDSEQAIWGVEALAHRTVSRLSVPGEQRKQLAPEKVKVVHECLAYWGRTTAKDTTVASHSLQRILSEENSGCQEKHQANKTIT